MLQNFEGYGPYAEGIKNGKIIVNVSDINKDTYEQYYNGIANILRDGIETEFVQNTFVEVRFDNITIELSIVDLLFTIIMWNLLIATDTKIEPKHLFFETNITGKSIKNYIDKFFIEPNRKKFNNMKLNNIIDDTMYKFLLVDEFDMYLSNTINLEDTINLMNERPAVYEALHVDFSNIPLEDVKNVGMEYTNKLINEIKNSDHCLADSFRSSEGVNTKQFKEFAVNIGTKPDGQGSVYPAIINNSYINGGINDLASAMIESSTGRTAQIMSKRNVATSGHFARLLRSNNMDTWLHSDPTYKCNTKNLQRVFIKDSKMLKRLNNRYYKLSDDGLDHLLKADKDKHLIGQTIMLYSPMTCASKANGHGICYRCYGDLAHTNYDINIGVIAAETLSDPLTQRLLSAKHLLESLIKKIIWPEGFSDLFEMESNIIKLNDEMNYKGYKLLIDPNDISLEEEYEDYVYNEYITGFEVEYPDGSVKKFYTSEADNIYIDSDLNDVIRSKAEPFEGKIQINMTDLKDSNLFVMYMHNDELSKTLNMIKSLLNKDEITRSHDRHSILQAVSESVIEGGLDIDSIHLEVILSNQIRAEDDILQEPQWEYPDEPYTLLTLNKALLYNPSPIISLTHEKIGKALYNPLTFRKNKPSFLDLFFVEKPSEFISASHVEPAKKKKEKSDKVVPGIEFVEKEK